MFFRLTLGLSLSFFSAACFGSIAKSLGAQHYDSSLYIGALSADDPEVLLSYIQRNLENGDKRDGEMDIFGTEYSISAIPLSAFADFGGTVSEEQKGVFKSLLSAELAKIAELKGLPAPVKSLLTGVVLNKLVEGILPLIGTKIGATAFLAGITATVKGALAYFTVAVAGISATTGVPGVVLGSVLLGGSFLGGSALQVHFFRAIRRSMAGAFGLDELALLSKKVSETQSIDDFSIKTSVVKLRAAGSRSKKQKVDESLKDLIASYIPELFDGKTNLLLPPRIYLDKIIQVATQPLKRTQRYDFRGEKFLGVEPLADSKFLIETYSQAADDATFLWLLPEGFHKSGYSWVITKKKN